MAQAVPTDLRGHVFVAQPGLRSMAAAEPSPVRKFETTQRIDPDHDRLPGPDQSREGSRDPVSWQMA